MAAKHKASLGDDLASLYATEALNALNTSVTRAGERALKVFEASLGAWGGEARRFHDDMLADGAAAFEQLKTCKSPLEVLTVEQAWVTARSKAFLEAGLRLGQAVGGVAQVFHTPPPAPGA